MKNFRILFVCIILLCFFSCSKDQDIEPLPKYNYTLKFKNSISCTNINQDKDYYFIDLAIQALGGKFEPSVINGINWDSIKYNKDGRREFYKSKIPFVNEIILEMSDGPYPIVGFSLLRYRIYDKKGKNMTHCFTKHFFLYLDDCEADIQYSLNKLYNEYWLPTRNKCHRPPKF